MSESNSPPAAPGVDDPSSSPVLVVDDEALIRKMTCRILERLGYESLTASCGEEALSLFAAHGGRIRALILDQSMPGMTGVEVARRMRQEGVPVPILLATGLASSDVRALAEEDPFTEVLEKPYRKQELANALERLSGPVS